MQVFRGSTATFFIVAAAGIVVTSQHALAATAALTSSKEPTFIAGIVILLLAGRIFGELMLRLGQPPVMGQLLAGVALGPSLFGAFFPHLREAIFAASSEQRGMLEAVSQLGILMLLLLTGMETDLALVRKVRTPALLIALSGVAVPLICGFALGEVLPAALVPDAGKRLATSIFLGTALSISSIKIVAMVVRDMNFMRRNLGQIIVASAIIEDTAGWIIISVALGIAARNAPDVLSLARTVGGIALFLVASFTIGRTLVFRLIRFINDTFQSDFAVITAILVVMGLFSLTTSALGVQTVLGAFIAGVLVGESPILTRHIDAQLRGLIVALFTPVFFGMAGMGADLRVLADPHLLLLTAALVLIASVGKFTGAGIGALLGGLSGREAVALGCGMNARGSTEVIVATIGLTTGAFSQNLFTMIVTMAMLTTTAMPPMLRRALTGLPMRPEEKARLEREEVDARGFLASLERLLLAVDTSAVGTLAARLAGSIAGARGMPLTIVELQTARVRRPKVKKAGDEPAETKQAVESGVAASVASLEKDRHDEPPRKVDITEEKSTDRRDVTEFADKGFDLLFVGVDGSVTSEGHFTPKLTEIVEGHSATLALLVGKKAFKIPETGARILVPVTGTAASRRGAEIAFVLARGLEASVTALYVSRGGDKQPRNSLLSITRRNEEAVLRDIVRLAARYRVDVRTAIAANSSPDIPILRRAATHDLVVMGVNRRPGDTFFLGNTAEAVAARFQGPVLFIADTE